jgi:hypothetical protein
MATATQYTYNLPPEYVQQRQKDLLATAFGTEGAPGLIGTPQEIAAQQVAGFTPSQLAAFGLAQQGIGAFQPYVQTGAQTLGTGVASALSGTQQFTPTSETLQPYMDPYQQQVTQQALAEIERQGQLAQSQLAGQATKAGAFGGARYGIQEAELSRNIQDIKSRRIFEDASRNYQQALASAQQASEAQQRRALEASRLLGSFGTQQAGLGQLAQQMYGQDINTLLGIGGQQQQLAQAGLEAARQNILAQQQEPFRRISYGAELLAGLPFGGQTIQQAPVTAPNPFLSFAGGIGSLGTGIGSLLEGFGSFKNPTG